MKYDPHAEQEPKAAPVEVYCVGFILDTDIGSDIDDAMALLLCLRLPDLDLRAVTTVYGQVELRARIARKLLRLARCDVPVAVGQSCPMQSPTGVWHTGIEGEGLLDQADLDASCAEFGLVPNAVDLLSRLTREDPGAIEIISIGPLTNIAAAIESDPEFKTRVSRIWAMIAGVSHPAPPPNRPLAPGESFVAASSHNIRCDVGAARIVLESGIPLVMVGNDVTTQVRIDLDGIRQVEDTADEMAGAVVRMMRAWLDYRSDLFGQRISWTCLHDALVVAEAYGMGFTERDRVDVELSEDGTTRVTARPASPIEVCRTVRSSGFERWYLASVTGIV